MVLTGTYYNTIMRAYPTNYWTFAEHNVKTVSSAVKKFTNSVDVDNFAYVVSGTTKATGYINGSALKVSKTTNVALTSPIVMVGEYSIEGWVYLSDGEYMNVSRQILGSAASSIAGVRIYNNKLKVPNEANGTSSTAVVATDVWTHVVITVNPSGGSTGCNYYINGSLVKTSAVPAIASTSFDFIGNYNNTENFGGIIDELVTYDRVLTLNEIQNHYNSGASLTVNPTPTIAVPSTTAQH